MFGWILRIFRKKTGNPEISEYEKKQLERIKTILQDDQNASQTKRKMKEDIESRINKKDKGGSSSSPITSP